jgi:hypothetical protein
MTHKVEIDGFEIVHDVLDATERQRLICSLGPVSGAGKRGILTIADIARLARSDLLCDLIRPHLDGHPRPVRAIYFDKSPHANWLVPWHQDLTLAVRENISTEGFGPWSLKDGVHHVQPPISLLEQMITIRLHLDAVDASNGALRVLPGSHLLGRLSADQITEQRSLRDEFLCTAPAGAGMLMRPLLLHASGRSSHAGHRRVLHIEYASFDLPGELEWA